MQAGGADQVAVGGARSKEQRGPAAGDRHVQSSEPRRQGGRRGHRDEESVIPLDDVEDLAERAGDRCVVEEVGVVDEERQCRISASRVNQGVDIAWADERHALPAIHGRPAVGPRHHDDGAPARGDRGGEDSERVGASGPVRTAHEEDPAVPLRNP